MTRELAAEFLALAEKQRAIVPLMIGHRALATSLLCTGDITEGREHYNQALELFDPAAHRGLATRFGQDVGVTILSWRHWLFGCLATPRLHSRISNTRSRTRARSATLTLMLALYVTGSTHILCGNYAAANAQSDEVVPLADEKGSTMWKAYGMLNQGCVFSLTESLLDAVQTITSGLTALRSTGSTLWIPSCLAHLAPAYAELGQFYDASRCIGEAMTLVETTKETWFEAEVHRIAGKSRSSRCSRTPRKLKRISSARSRSPASKKPNPGNFAQQ